VADKNFKVKSGLNIPITSAAILTTDANGNISSTATLPIANGGTGQTSANNALNALLPIQDGGTVNYSLQSGGTNVSWAKLYNQTIKNAGTSVNPRGIINFVGATLSDDSGSDTTTITLGSASTSVSSNITLAAANKYFVDTTSARTLTLPASPSLGDEIQIFDATGTAFTNNITLSRNGNKINGISDDGIIDINGASATLTYTGSTYGWRFE
jgi:hypothetical protein